MTSDRAILLFPSIHDVMAAERALLAAKVRCDLIPVPRELSSECGMAVEVDGAAIEHVKQTLGGLAERCEGIHVI